MSRNTGSRSGKPYDRPPRGPRAVSSDGKWLHDKAPGVPQSVVRTGRGDGAVSNSAAALNTKLVVSNLHYNVTPKDLVSIFGQIGTLTREPIIKYDRSGRSTGIAFITYETAVEATRARKQFNGILAKGQPMTVEYDTYQPRPKKQEGNTSGSLADRISKPPLLDRLDSAAVTKPQTKNSPPERPNQGDTGPIRTRFRRRGGGPRHVPKKPATAEQLDKELDAYLNNDETSATHAADPVASAPAPTAEAPVAATNAGGDGDVEMA